MAEECDQKIQARWAQEHTEIAALKKEKEQLHREIEAMKEREKAIQAVVHFYYKCHSNQYIFIYSLNKWTSKENQMGFSLD